MLGMPLKDCDSRLRRSGRCHVLECRPGLREPRTLAGEGLEAPDDHIAVERIELDETG